MKMLMLGLLFFTVACNGSGPSQSDVQQLVSPLFFSPEANFKVNDFTIVSHKELQPGMDGAQGMRYVVKFSAQALSDCQHETTTIDQQTSSLSGLVPGNTRSSFAQNIHECLTAAYEDKKVQQVAEEWKGRLGKADYSGCRKNDFSCGGEPITQELINTKVQAFREMLRGQVAARRLVKAGEKMEITSHYVNLKKPANSEKWMVTGIGQEQ